MAEISFMKNEVSFATDKISSVTDRISFVLDELYSVQTRFRSEESGRQIGGQNRVSLERASFGTDETFSVPDWILFVLNELHSSRMGFRLAKVSLDSLVRTLKSTDERISAYPANPRAGVT